MNKSSIKGSTFLSACFTIGVAKDEVQTKMTEIFEIRDGLKQ